MEQIVKDFLMKYKNTYVPLLQLEQLFPMVDYEMFAEMILSLERQQILQRVKASGENGKSPSLAYRYKIYKSELRQDLKSTIVQMKKQFHPAIYIEYYLTKTMEEWQQDESSLLKLNTYIQKNGFPTTKALVSERSFEIFQDEKFLTEGGGKGLLEKVRVWDDLQIWPIADPVSFAVNPSTMFNKHHLHLIVENKATYYGLLPALNNSQFTSLLYGEGKGILSTIDVFKMQLPLLNAKHTYFYFGDLDFTGIEIWYLLSKKITVHPAIPFYIACFNYPQVVGKAYQRKNNEAIQTFFNYFSIHHQQILLNLFDQGCYYPQEVLKSEQLQKIWREADWSMKKL